MPNAVRIPVKTIPLLMVVAGALVATYVALIMSTIMFAAWQTQLATNMDDTRADIARLETKYYAQITSLDGMDPASKGLVKPGNVAYVTASKTPGLTFAGR